MVFGVGDELDVEVSASTGDFTRGMSRAENSLDDLRGSALQSGAALNFLQSRADETGDEIREAGLSASGASFSFNQLAGSSTTASTGVSGLSTVLTLSLLPALLTVGTALIPVVTALGGLASILGAIGFVGIAGGIAAVATNGEFLKEQFMGLVSTFQDAFAPAIEDATSVINILIGELEDIIPELVPTGNTLNEIASLFEQLGSAVIQSIPAFVDLAISLTREFLPAAIRLAQNVLPQIPGLIRRLVDVFRRLAPTLMETVRFITELSPQLLELGFAALNVVGPALATIGDALLNVINRFNGMDGSIQSLLISFGTLGPIVLGIASLVGGLSLPILAVIGAIAALGVAWQQDLGRIREITNRVFADIQAILGDNIPQLLDAARQFWATWGDEITLILEGVADILGTTIVNAIDLITTTLTGVLQLLSGDFQGAFETFEGFFGRWIDRITSLINRLTGGAFQGLVNDAIKTVNEIGSAFGDFSEQFGIGDFTFEELQQVEFGEPAVAQAQNVSARNAATEQRLEVVVEEDTDLTEARIEETSERVVTDRERRATRLNNRGTGR